MLRWILSWNLKCISSENLQGRSYKQVWPCIWGSGTRRQMLPISYFPAWPNAAPRESFTCMNRKPQPAAQARSTAILARHLPLAPWSLPMSVLEACLASGKMREGLKKRLTQTLETDSVPLGREFQRSGIWDVPEGGWCSASSRWALHWVLRTHSSKERSTCTRPKQVLQHAGPKAKSPYLRR